MGLETLILEFKESIKINIFLLFSEEENIQNRKISFSL